MVKMNGTRPFSLIGIGEVMLRLSPVGKERISYCETFEKRAGGSELSAAVLFSSASPSLLLTPSAAATLRISSGFAIIFSIAEDI